jgi:hypothetical protein
VPDWVLGGPQRGDTFAGLTHFEKVAWDLGLAFAETWPDSGFDVHRRLPPHVPSPGLLRRPLLREIAGFGSGALALYSVSHQIEAAVRLLTR